jgi:serine protease Do
VTLGRLEDGERTQQAGLNQPPTEAPSVTRRALGLELSGVTEELRRLFSIKETVKGVVVTRVDPNSAAADKRIQPGEVIVEVGQEPVANPADVTRRVDALKKEGRKSALLLVSNAQGEVRFVAVTIE